MNKLTIHERKLLEILLAEAQSRLSDTLLETCADLEYRMCLIELGLK